MSPGYDKEAEPVPRRPLVGYEVMAMIRKEQVHSIGGRDMQAQVAFVVWLFEITA